MWTGTKPKPAGTQQTGCRSNLMYIARRGLHKGIADQRQMCVGVGVGGGLVVGGGGNPPVVYMQAIYDIKLRSITQPRCAIQKSISCILLWAMNHFFLLVVPNRGTFYIQTTIKYVCTLVTCSICAFRYRLTWSICASMCSRLNVFTEK